ncbi:MAG TPA: sigma-70 family RNA polymerase sigma factor [Blastocatellia bacterium]|nr:sigma-70 family RNA polymerase sigma factor [Blastocatellia bacterium]
MAEEITQLLINWSNGDQSAIDQLMPLVYDELHRLAASYLRRERDNHTLQPTALVHEAYLRMIDQHSVSWQNRAQFFGLAAQVMRNILVDHARGHRAAKRGGAEYTLSVSRADRPGRRPDLSLIALDDALNDLAAIKPQHARVVELRFFGGLTIEETAEITGISHATVERDRAFARAWLKKELSG